MNLNHLHLVSLFLCSSLIFLSCLPFVSSECITTGEPGTLLVQVHDSNGNVICAPGFLCPNFVQANASTWPVYCPPTPDCALTRRFGEICDEAMGKYEPMLCPEGDYCPQYDVQLTCPKDYFCPSGTKDPKKCAPLSHCPEGSSKPLYYGSLLGTLAVLVAIAVVWKFYEMKLRNAELTLMPDVVTVNPTTAADNNDDAQEMHSPRSEGSPNHRAHHIKVLCDGFRRRRGAMPPMRVSFDNLSLELPLPDGTKKRILSGVSGHLQPGKVTAIMGPSGSGKSTLLNTILGRVDPTWTKSGTLSLNGDTDVAKYRSTIGFVPQDDVLHNELTVYKNAYYSSEVRLPADWSASDRHDFRSAVIESLGLAAQRNVVIGDETTRGVSGGQRKRASVGVELVAAPLMMMLDEPTSGLDSNTSLELCHTLVEIASRTELPVSMIIHQPRVEIWNALQELLILAPGGRTVYQGPQSEIREFFETHYDVQFPPTLNPADVVMDTVSARGAELADKWDHIQHQTASEGRLEAVKSAEELEADAAAVQGNAKWLGASVARQFVLFHLRSVEKQLNNRSLLFIELFVTFLCGLILGQGQIDFQPVGRFKDYKAISVSPISAIPAQMHMYTLMSLGLAAATAGVYVFCNDKITYRREAGTGISRVAIYFGTVTAQVYRVCASSLMFAAFFHCLSKPHFRFGPYYALCFVAYMCIYGYAGCVAILSEARNAPLVAAVMSIAYAVFNGFIDFPLFLKRLSYAFWFSQVLQELTFSKIEDVYEDPLPEWGWSRGHIGESYAVLLAMVCGYHIIGCTLLVVLSRGK
eukprot:PhM_4_TR14194/c0_g1_i1/m.875